MWRAAMLLLTLSGSANAYTITDKSEGASDDILSKIADSFADPAAVQFRRLHLKNGTVCGEVNAKNGFGAYTGYAEFFTDDGWLFVAGLQGIAPATVAKRCD